MAKPGPAIALAALAAFFLMRGKGGGSGIDGLDDLPDGTKVPDDSPSDPSAPSGGGTKVPSGTGAGGGKWDPGAVSPTEFWISPDCQSVVEGVSYFDDALVPAIIDAQKQGHDRQNAWMEKNGTPETNLALEQQDIGGRTRSDVYSLLAIAFKMAEWSESGFDGIVWSDEEFMHKSPMVCIKQFPAFDMGTKFNSLKKADDATRFEEALGEYANVYPELVAWLMSLEERLVGHEALLYETFGFLNP
jgi:hypothetical protein